MMTTYVINRRAAKTSRNPKANPETLSPMPFLSNAADAAFFHDEEGSCSGR